MVAVWPAPALVILYELLMIVIQSGPAAVVTRAALDRHCRCAADLNDRVGQLLLWGVRRWTVAAVAGVAAPTGRLGAPAGGTGSDPLIRKRIEDIPADKIFA